MKNDFVTILDFGSSKITCMAATKVGDSGEFVIRAVGQSAYSGFDEQSWYEPDSIPKKIEQAIGQVESKMKAKIKEVFVGVPGVFCAEVTSEATVPFQTKKKIDEVDVQDIIEKADIYKCEVGYSPLGGKPVYFMLDNALKMVNPVGFIAGRLMGVVSFSYVKDYFRNSVTSALKQIGVSKIYFVNTCEAQASYISHTMFGDSYSLVIDIGHITTNVMLCGGNGLLFQRTFALGSGYFAGDLCQVLGCDFNFAMQVLEKVNLNLDVKDGDAYSLNGRMIDAYKTNEVVRARIEQIAQYVMRCVQMYDKEIPADTPIVLTGGGLAYLRGGADCLSMCLMDKKVRYYDSLNVQTRRNEYTSCYGLIYEAVKKENNQGGLFAFLSKFRKGDK
ncbi:MAG: hypothetical protein K2M64_00935 [Clostridia bacterium]|nr:hypothetical protein [Clostridia bacterium]